jgi:threonine dehydratase
MIAYRDVSEAATRISSLVHRTPVLTCEYLNELSGRQLYFKAETLQKTGSFKARGACNAVSFRNPPVFMKFI